MIRLPLPEFSEEPGAHAVSGVEWQALVQGKLQVCRFVLLLSGVDPNAIAAMLSTLFDMAPVRHGSSA